MSRVELYERIRKDSRDEGLGIRALAAKHHVHRRNVREALASATPPERKVPGAGVAGVGAVDDGRSGRGWSPTGTRRASSVTPARRVHQRLVAEYGAEVAESTVRAYVAQVHFELDNTLRRGDGPSDARAGRRGRVRFRGVLGLGRRGAGEVLDVLHAA